MTEWPHISFILVPQTDRRQQADRRCFWRGSRRASDVAATQATLAPHDPAVIWTGAQIDDSRGSLEKTYLH